MDNSKMTKGILDKYYENLMTRNEWSSLLSDDFLLSGTVAKETRGKQSYIDNSFFKMVKRFKIKTRIVSGDNACALVNYDLVSPRATPSHVTWPRFGKQGTESWIR